MASNDHHHATAQAAEGWPPLASVFRSKASGAWQWRHWLAWLCAIGIWLAAPLPAAADVPSEQEVKAACVFSLSKYVTWPEEAFASPESPLVIAEFGSSSIGDHLRVMVRDKTLNGRPIVFKRVQSATELGEVMHVLFISRSERQQCKELIEKLKERSVLTVGESDEFLDLGGIINLDNRSRKIRLEINLDAARAGRLTISSKLLSLAEVIKGKPR